MRRAAHQLFDRPLVFEDPLAVRILGPETAASLAPEPENLVERRLRGFMAVRSRYAEERLGMAVAHGAKQYVVLGAGLDTFAYRNPYPELRVFEVDFPATQVWKQERLQAAGIPLPGGLQFAPVDFEKETLAGGLRKAGFAEKDPAFFSWLGVTPYLGRETVFATLRWIVSLCAGNGVVFDYALPRAALDEQGKKALDALMKRVAAAGEPFRGFFTREELEPGLKKMGYEEIEDLSPEQIDARYFAGRTDGLSVSGGLAHLLCAVGKRGK